MLPVAPSQSSSQLAAAHTHTLIPSDQEDKSMPKTNPPTNSPFVCIFLRVEKITSETNKAPSSSYPGPPSLCMMPISWTVSTAREVDAAETVTKNVTGSKMASCIVFPRSFSFDISNQTMQFSCTNRPTNPTGRSSSPGLLTWMNALSGYLAMFELSLG